MMPGGILHRRDCACGVAVAGNGRAVEMLLLNRGEVKRSRRAARMSGRQAELKTHAQSAPPLPCSRASVSR